ncbi:MAG: tripartite tricarboxylate transporter substrate binding protein [Deltaproteobacteria bacterium]|nr:tripartite tricarboxylate transporter substrate binding protein [Deltaproteobacteria bacterium]
MQMRSKRSFPLFAAASLLLLGCSSAFAAEYPTKPISFIIPYQAGGFTDVLSRALAEAVKKELGQPVVCENKAGGGGTVGLAYLVSRPADGYAIGLITPGAYIASHMGKSPFHPLTDLTFVSRISGGTTAIVVRADSPFKTLQDLIQHVKQNPGKITYGTSGFGTITHLAMEELSDLAGNLNWKLVPYKSGAEAATALLGGHVDVVSDAPSWQPLVDAGKLRLLAMFTEKRSTRYPNVPTVKESGYAMSVPGPNGIVGPKGLPKPIVQKLEAAYRKAMQDPEVLAVVKQYDLTPLYLGADDYARAAQQEYDWSGKLVKKVGLEKK